MRILLTADGVGGVLQHAVELSRALAARGTEVALAIEGGPLAPDQRELLAGARLVSVHEGTGRLEWMEDPWDDVAASGRRLLALESDLRPDVIHLGSYSHGALPFRAPKLVTGHSCVLSWWEAVRGGVAPPEWDRYRCAVRAGLRGADLVAAPSRAMAKALRRHHGPLPDVHVVPNGRDPARFPPGPKEELILAAGRIWDEGKNTAAVVRAASRLPWPVYVAGEGAAPGTVASQQASGCRLQASGSTPTPTQPADPGYAFPEACGLQPVAFPPTPTGPPPVTFLGRLPEPLLARWYARAAIFVHPARYEPFGLTVLEAALAGCALVLGDIPSLREVWDGAAAFVAPNDQGGLERAMARLAHNRARREALARRSRTRALDFGPGRMAGAYLALYRELAGLRLGGEAS